MFKKSIRTKLMTLLLAATIIPMALSMLISDFYIKNQVTDKAIHENRSLLQVGKINILNYMNTVSRESLSVYNAINSPTSLYSIIERGNSRQNDIEAIDQKSRLVIYQHLLNMYQSMKEIHQIHLQIRQGSNKSWSYLLARGFFRGGWETDGGWPIGQADNPVPFVEATHKSGYYELDWNRSVPEENVITLRRPIIRTPSDEVIGYLSIDLSTSELVNSCKQLTLSDQERIYIMNRQGELICGADTSQYGQPLHTDWSNKLTASKAESGYFKWSDDSFSGYMVYDTIQTQYMDWIIVKQLPYSYLYENAKGIRIINSLVIAVSLIVAVLATLIVSVQFTKPIKRLIGRMNQVQSGNLSAADIPIQQGSDEFGILARRFNNMITTIDDLINREYKLEIANKTNQLKAMQAQINPHFLNNALQSIGTLALQSDAPKVYKLISAMARMMRYNMNTEETVVPLSVEIAHARSYLELQQQRFGDQLDVRLELDPASESIPVPKMMLQPLIENYFKHGYEPHDGSCEIRIRSEVDPEQEWLLIHVEDNGTGMEPGPLAELQQRLGRSGVASPEMTDRNIGLSNVAMRLKLYYSEMASMRVDSLSSGGFHVTLRIPLQVYIGEELKS